MIRATRSHWETIQGMIQSKCIHEQTTKQSGEQRISDSNFMSEVRKDPLQHGQGTQDRDQDRGGRVRTISQVHSMEEEARQTDVSGKVLRKVQNSLRKATSFWNEIHGLIIIWGVDQETITSNVRTMNQDMIEDLIRNPRGTKRIRELAASLGITPRNLRIVAEVCNPSCFKQAVEKHGLERF